MALNQSYGIKATVGAQPGAVNNRADVEIIQKLLNEHATRVGYLPITVNGVASPSMIQAIQTFQQKVVGMKAPDGRVDPSGKTLFKLNEPASALAPGGGGFLPAGKSFQERLDAFLADAKAVYGVTIPAGTEFRKPEDAQKWHVAHMIYFNSFASLKPANSELVNGRKLIAWSHLSNTTTVWQHVSWQDFLRDANGQVPMKQGTGWAPERRRIRRRLAKGRTTSLRLGGSRRRMTAQPSLTAPWSPRAIRAARSPASVAATGRSTSPGRPATSVRRS